MPSKQNIIHTFSVAALLALTACERVEPSPVSSIRLQGIGRWGCENAAVHSEKESSLIVSESPRGELNLRIEDKRTGLPLAWATLEPTALDLASSKAPLEVTSKSDAIEIRQPVAAQARANGSDSGTFTQVGTRWFKFSRGLLQYGSDTALTLEHGACRFEGLTSSQPTRIAFGTEANGKISGKVGDCEGCDASLTLDILSGAGAITVKRWSGEWRKPFAFHPRKDVTLRSNEVRHVEKRDQKVTFKASAGGLLLLRNLELPDGTSASGNAEFAYNLKISVAQDTIDISGAVRVTAKLESYEHGLSELRSDKVQNLRLRW